MKFSHATLVVVRTPAVLWPAAPLYRSGLKIFVHRKVLSSAMSSTSGVVAVFNRVSELMSVNLPILTYNHTAMYDLLGLACYGLEESIL